MATAETLSKPFNSEPTISSPSRLILTKFPQPHGGHWNMRGCKRKSRVCETGCEKHPAGGGADIVGTSPAMLEVFKDIGRVAATDTAVLVQGESGTGKELVARSIHQNSHRASGAFVAVNCASIPGDLLESELFGHERGAFTGAVSRKAGKFEVANGGTIFLDEIGDLPLNLQPKLLRVLQEHSFERVGGNELVQCDFRVLAATNCELNELLEGGHFRQDLYYRVNAFTIHLPPLRDRRSDIIPLAE